MHLAMVAALYTGEQADQLRRAMAAWRRSGNLAKYQQDLTDRMSARGYEKEFIDAHLQTDRRLRRIWFSGEPCGELRVARLSQRVVEAL